MTGDATPYDIVKSVIARLLALGATGPPYRVKPMLAEWKGEDVPGNPVWFPDAVEYLTEAERSQCALTLRDGKIWDADGMPFDTRDARTLHPDGSGRAIFVMDAAGNFYASKRHAPGEFHHSSLVAGAPVAAAGELEVVDGVLTAITDQSGHYKPSLPYTAQAIDRLRKNNISFQGVIMRLQGRLY
jgi:hypothetical protein